MHTNTKFVISLFVWAFQNINATIPQYTIARWYDNKKAAITVNFDDNLPGQFSTALPIMNAKNVKGTFYVITSTAGSQWAVLQSAIDAGHEVGSHSVSHPTDLNFPAVNMPEKEVQIEAELKNAYDALMANLTGQTSLSISWPYGKGGGGNDSIVRRVAKKYYFAARNTTAGTVNGDAYTHFQNSWFAAFGRDYYLQTGGILMTSTTSKANMGTFITEIIKTNGWFAPYYHAVNQVGGYNNVTTENFTAHIDTIASYRDVAWITTFGNASKYHHERNAGAALSEVSEDASKWVLNLSANLANNATFNHPLTIRLAKPGFTISSISQNGNALPIVDDGDTLQFNAIPDDGNIELTKSVTSALNNINENSIFTLNNNHGLYKLSVENQSIDFLKISFFTISGSLISTIYNGRPISGKQYFDIPLIGQKKGIYIVNVMSNRGSKSFRLINFN